MNQPLFSAEDLKEIESRGLTLVQVQEQFAVFKKGLHYCRLNRPCTMGDGIMAIDPATEDRLIAICERAVADGRAVKFVPASGAATRMFKSLLVMHDHVQALAAEQPVDESAPYAEDQKAVRVFIDNLKRFAFYPELKANLEQCGLSPDQAGDQESRRMILERVLFEQGLDLARRPKGLIPFHVYPDQTRTSFEEHLVEGVAYLRDRQGLVRLHWTVAAEHLSLVQKSLEPLIKRRERTGARFHVTYSVQDPSTDTLAADKNNRLARDARGRLIWHPGGHGALLKNLNDLQADIVFIKNVDNVAPDRLKTETIRYKKILGGLLVALQEKIIIFLELLKSGTASTSNVKQALRFAQEWLSVQAPEAVTGGTEAVKIEYLIRQLNRPLRICGMVRNEGEPGGGPFWVQETDGTISLQIVESSQVEHDSAQQETIWRSSTHFNPVDLVCGLRDDQGRPFDLFSFRDNGKGLVALKSRDGEEYRVYEWPGLWNGAMAGWNTVFVEVPLATFTPVKTVMDLLRSEHQPG